jgi:hypothetical protein
VRKISSKNGNLEFVKHFVVELSLTNIILSSQYLGNSGETIIAQKSISPHFSHEPGHEFLVTVYLVTAYSLLVVAAYFGLLVMPNQCS